MTTRRRMRERGSVMIETALSLLVFLMILFGIMDYGRALFAYNFVSFAAGQGARYAMVRGSSSSTPATATTVQDYVRNQAVALDKNAITVATTWAPDNKPGSTVQVAVTYSFQPVVPFLPSSAMVFKNTTKMTITR